MKFFLNKREFTIEPKNFFDTEHLQANLKGRSVKGGAITIIAQILKFVLQTGGLFILARMLDPSDFGLIGMVTVILGFIELFKDLGLSTATIQKKEINQTQVSTLFWINICFSLLCTFLVVCLAPSISDFYHEPRLNLIVIILATSFPLGGLTVQHLSLLRRQMQFKTIARIDIISMFISVFSAIIYAVLGGGYWSLVVWRLGQSVVTTLGVWLTCPWRPEKPQWDPSVLPMLKFGRDLALFGVFNYFSRNLDNFLIGRYWGANQLGIYSVAYKILLMPIEQINAPITSVALPTLSRLQSEPEKFNKYYYRGIATITTIGMPIVGFLWSTIHIIIPLTIGQQWVSAVAIFQLLIPSAYIGTFNVAMGWAYVSLGKGNQQLRWGILSSSVTAVIFFLSVRWGAAGVAAAYSFSRPLFLLIGLSYCYKNTSLSVINLFKSILTPFYSSLIAAAGITTINYFININQSITLGIDFITYITIYVIIYLIHPKDRTILTDAIKSVIPSKV
ncbi:MAG: lipopolysaccharide biosynthesis protein [Thermosynechococcaceae cyanobacterium]